MLLMLAGAAGSAEQDLAPAALDKLEKLLLLQRKLHGQASDVTLLKEVASWGITQVCACVCVCVCVGGRGGR